MTTGNVRTGLDRFVQDGFSALKGKRVALLANPVAVDSQLVHLLDRCLENEVELVRLFGPEHGLLGDAQDMADVDGHRDRKTGLDVKSLYGTQKDSLFLQTKDLDDVDVLLCDLQDIGSRYYTFSYTIAFAMRAAQQARTKVVVLDRPNPIGGDLVEGNLVKREFSSFVGEYPLPNRHGMTLGELCYFFKAHDELHDLDLDVIKMENYQRGMHFSETGLPWVMPSPNMPTPDTALVYPGGCLFEGTNLSEGRGTTRPFELIGAPYIDDPDAFCQRAREQGVCQGIALRPCYFRPTFQKHANELCGGLQLHITSPHDVDAMKTAVAILNAARSFAGFAWRSERYEFVSDRLAIDLLFGDDQPRQQLEEGATTAEVLGYLDRDRDAALAQRASHLFSSYDDKSEI
ncbi:MAG: DUF1343 domain-containing protein [Deltaproteobacteria bacterium]|nr:DUF1343 domain-containing protein [Deltaproteobacteria bacterium]